MNISSAIVHARSGAAEAMLSLQTQLSALGGVEIHAVSNEGKIVVTLEADSDEGTVDLFERIRQLDGVMSAAMVYHQFDPDEPDSEEEL